MNIQSNRIPDRGTVYSQVDSRYQRFRPGTRGDSTYTIPDHDDRVHSWPPQPPTQNMYREFPCQNNGRAAGCNAWQHVDNPQDHARLDNRHSNSYGHGRNLPIHKWNLKFTADSSSQLPKERNLNAFLKRIDLMHVSEGITYDETSNGFHFLLSKCALDWYMQYRHTYLNWDELRVGLERQFTTPLTNNFSRC